MSMNTHRHKTELNHRRFYTVGTDHNAHCGVMTRTQAFEHLIFRTRKELRSPTGRSFYLAFRDGNEQTELQHSTSEADAWGKFLLAEHKRELAEVS